MKPIKISSEYKLALLIAIVLTVIAYPRLWTLTSTPHQGSVLSVHDPGPSYMNFIPGFRLIQFEAIQNHNWLWSSMRLFGMPVLAGEVQSAPLFPLTLALMWLPEQYFWPAFAVTRLVALGVGSYLLGFFVFGFRRFGSYVFLLSFGYALYHLRFLNHPYINGILATVWYLFFVGKYLIGRFETFSRMLLCLGIVLALFSVATSGFPEAMVIGAILSLLVLIPFVVANPPSRKTIGDLVLAHFIGVAISLPQVLALNELVSLAGTGFARRGAAAQVAWPTWLFQMVTRLTPNPSGMPYVHYFGFIPVTFFLLGAWNTVRRRAFTALDVSACLCLAFFCLKNFQISETLNEFFVSLPVIGEVYFFSFSFPLFLLFFAYYAAKGADLLTSERDIRKVLFILAALLVVSGFQIRAVPAEDWDWIRTIKLHLLFLIFVCGLAVDCKMGWLRQDRLALFVGVLLATEFLLTRSLIWNLDTYSATQRRVGAEVIKTLGESQTPLTRRDSSETGNFMGVGIASGDGGYAVLPERLALFRRTLFKIPEYTKGLAPLVGETRPDAWRLASISLHAHDETNITNRSRAEYSKLKLLGKWEGETVYYDEQALPRAFLTSDCTVAETLREATSKTLDPSELRLGGLVVETQDSREKTFCRRASTSHSAVSVAADHGGTVLLGRVKGPGWLVLNDTYYPDWIVKDRVGGQMLPIRPANITFRAVPLFEPREYELEFSYRPRWWKISLPFVIAGILGILYFALRAVCTYRRSSSGSTNVLSE